MAAATDESTGHHDLERCAEDVRAEYVASYPRLPIRWGRRAPRSKRNSIRLGSYDHQTTLIRIHPSLDSAAVPEYFIKSIIHHEYLHHVLGPSHNNRFRRHERMFRLHKEARAWLRRNLAVLLGRRQAEVHPPRPPVSRPTQLSLF